MTTKQLRADAGLACGRSHSLGAALLRLSEAIWIWRARTLSRGDLVQLGDDVLKDIGLSRAAAYQEWSKPFWRK